MEFCLCAALKTYAFLLLLKAEMSSVTGGTYSGITGAGSWAVGFWIGVYAG